MIRRTLSTIIAAGSLALCVALCVLWVRSYRGGNFGDLVAFSTGDDHWELQSHGGGVMLYQRDAVPWFFSGPSTGGKLVARYNRRDVFGIAYWVPVAMTMVLPVIRLITWRRLRRRVAGGLCLRCGYDLRATPDRCPECGAAESKTRPEAPRTCAASSARGHI